MKSVEIIAESDHLRKIANAKPYIAIAELVWNALDADAKRVDIIYSSDEIGIDKVIIKDDGTGFSIDIAEKYFGSLGGSWKKEKLLSNTGRQLHGKQGQGRFKVFSLGEDVKWDVTYQKNGKKYNYLIQGKESKIKNFNISDEKHVIDLNTGVTVEVQNLFKQFKIYDTDVSLSTFSSVFAPYLNNYRNATIYINGQKLNIQDQIKNTIKFKLESSIISDDEKQHEFTLNLIEWKDLKIKELFFCDEDGFPFRKYDKQIRNIGDYGFSSYLDSEYFSMLNSNGEIEIAELKDELAPILIESIKIIKNYFVDRYLDEQKNIIETWIEEKVYPYSDDIEENTVESAEKKVFDILALNLNTYVDDFNEVSKTQKTLQFKLIKQAVENSPSDLKKIITEVINLPKETIDELSEILEYASLGSVISASKIITDRIRFISGFEEIVFDIDYRKHLKERSQLHKILSENTWFFGDEYHLSVSDKSLTEVLKKHKKLLDEDLVIDEPVKRIDGRQGIVDLMFSRAIPKNHSNEREHLIIELKAPKVSIRQQELNQIESYAFAVAKDERFHGLNTRWEFWILSNTMDDYAEMKANQDAYPKGTIFKYIKDVDITIKIKTWSEIIAEVKHRHQFVKDQLNLNIGKDDGLSFLKEKYKEYVGELIE